MKRTRYIIIALIILAIIGMLYVRSRIRTTVEKPLPYAPQALIPTPAIISTGNAGE